MHPDAHSVDVPPVKSPEPFRPVAFYGLAFAIAWTAWTPLLLHVRGLVALPVPFPVALFICQTIGAFAPLISLALLQRFSAPGLVERVLRRIRVKKVASRWLLWPAVVPVGIGVTSAILDAVLSGGGSLTILHPEKVDELGWGLLAVIPLTFVIALIGSPLGEEPGWRGYVLHQFASKGKGYCGSAVVAVLWWVWHLPLFLILGVAPHGYSFLEMLGHSLLIDCFYLLSGQNLLSAMLYHQGVNITFLFFAPKTQTVAGLVLLLGIALCVRMKAERQVRPARRNGSPTDHV